MDIHHSAVISPHARLDPSVKVGPFCVIGDHVTIGQETTLVSHVSLMGHTRIGARNRIYPFVSIGAPPQDIGYKGEDTRVIIGDDNIIREYSSINRATTKQNWETVIGNGNFIMAYSHIAHDCFLGNKIIMSNLTTLAGHTAIGDYTNMSGLVAVHQFVRIGAHVFVGGKAAIERDVPPFMITAGDRARLYGVNRVGLSRHGFSQDTIERLKKAYRIIWRENKKLSEGVDQVRRKMEPFPELEMLLDFIAKSERGIMR
jgi:UDP-N-acetylglucosamine acyltransferase